MLSSVNLILRYRCTIYNWLLAINQKSKECLVSNNIYCSILYNLIVVQFYLWVYILYLLFTIQHCYLQCIENIWSSVTPPNRFSGDSWFALKIRCKGCSSLICMSCMSQGHLFKEWMWHAICMHLLHGMSRL